MKKIILTLSIMGLSIIFTNCSSAEPLTKSQAATVNYIKTVLNEKGDDEVQKAYDEMIKEGREEKNGIKEEAEKKK